MTSSPTHLPTPPSFFLAFSHPPLPLFFLLALPHPPLPAFFPLALPTLFRRFSDAFPMMTSSSENRVASSPWRQPNELFAVRWCHLFSNGPFQQPIRSQGFGAQIWMNQSQATISNRQNGSNVAHSTTYMKILDIKNPVSFYDLFSLSI